MLVSMVVVVILGTALLVRYNTYALSYPALSYPALSYHARGCLRCPRCPTMPAVVMPVSTVVVVTLGTCPGHGAAGAYHSFGLASLSFK